MCAVIPVLQAQLLQQETELKALRVYKGMNDEQRAELDTVRVSKQAATAVCTCFTNAQLSLALLGMLKAMPHLPC